MHPTVMKLLKALRRSDPLIDAFAALIWPAERPNPLAAIEGQRLILPGWTAKDEAAMIALFREVPSAWWLDPERFGPADRFGNRSNFSALPVMHGSTRIRGNLIPSEPPVADAPPCPICPDGGKRAVMAIHGGEATMWDCFVCGTEFTRAGETDKSRKARHRKNGNFTKLPCGHTGAVKKLHPPESALQETQCDICKAVWEPRSNDPTGRSLGQGESIKMIVQSAPLVTFAHLERERQRIIEFLPDQLLNPPGVETLERREIAPQRPNCPSCTRSHPQRHRPIDGGPEFYRCAGCKHEWYC